MDEIRELWERIGLNMEAHDGLLEVLPGIYNEVIIEQKNRPSRMAYFDQFFSEIHGKRIAELASEKEKGASTVGAFCTYVPEEIIIALGGNCIGLCGGAEVATEEVEKILPRNTCPLIKSSFGFKLAKVCPYFELCDLVVGETTCDGKKKYYEILSDFVPVHVMELPQKKEESSKELWRKEVRKFAAKMEKVSGRKLDAGKLSEAVRVVNEKRRALKRLAEVRKAKPSVISGKDSLLISQIAFFDEPRRFTARLNELCDELEKRVEKGTGVSEDGSLRIMLSGCPMAIPNWKLPHIIEGMGATIVIEELCTGTRYYEDIVSEEEGNLEELLDSIAERYLSIDCAVFTPNDERIENIKRLAGEYKPDGIIYYSLVFCSPYSIEAYRAKKAVESCGIPFLHVETDYGTGDASLIMNRVQAFFEVIKGGK